ncbi:TPA: hypothetical protein DD712_00545 [Candidatus Acetothermia bacterium]|nr:hypothetical protein [Candidatus Acetothermia bacterium]
MHAASELSRGAAVGYICPEAAGGGPIALINEGDKIELDIPNKRLAVHIDEEEMTRRREGWKPSPSGVTEGFLARYAALVAPANKGAVLTDVPPLDGSNMWQKNRMGYRFLRR